MSEHLNVKLSRYSEAVATSIYSLQGKIDKVDAYATSIDAKVDETSAYATSIDAKVDETSAYATSIQKYVGTVKDDLQEQIESATVAIGTLIAGDYLPKAGGTMSGIIYSTAGDAVLSKNNLYANFGFSYANVEGGLVACRSVNYSTNPGGVEIFARNISTTGTTTHTLTIPVSGTMKWSGHFYSSGNINVGGVVYGAVWNDYAEFFERGEATEPGDIIALDESSDKEQYVKADNKSKLVIGVQSNTYGNILGGEKGKSIKENLEKFIPVGLSGRVSVKFTGKSVLGEGVVPSKTKGVGKLYSSKTDDASKIIGYIVQDDEPTSKKLRKVKMLIKKS